MISYLKKVLKEESGATAIEYALLVSLLGLAIISSVIALGDKLKAAFGGISDSLKVTEIKR
ncbi:Flp family type IVb pilin [Candidatus Liberibacter africanus]|uniref:Flp family type IVb pilin n=1 Tax=Liberibacter africanus TaxID=34020 RepID=UPI001AEB3035|nr:Flp family type IVb pilin [Candidatus Liberibacter africanus]QTP63858.1 Flp family type IVb pilin [Candidatus Liberibacter africanus]